MNIKTFNVSVQGASHIKRCKICQDASGHYSDDKMAIAVVCDGHGGDDYIRSDIGSKLCTKVTIDSIRSFLNDITAQELFSHKDEYEKRLRHLESCIITYWREAVREHYRNNAFTEDDLYIVSDRNRKRFEAGRIEIAYGTTMLAIARTSEFWFIMQIGDGKCVAVNQGGNLGFPLKADDPRCIMNATTSMCDTDALDSFRHFASQNLPAAIFIGTDGVDNSFANKEQLIKLYQTILYNFGTEAYEDAEKELKEYLPRLSAKGSGDDISIAAILDLDAVSELEIVKCFDEEKEKAKVAENARIKAQKNEEEKRLVEERYIRQQNELESDKKLMVGTKTEIIASELNNTEAKSEGVEETVNEDISSTKEYTESDVKSENVEQSAETTEDLETITEASEIVEMSATEEKASQTAGDVKTIEESDKKSVIENETDHTTEDEMNTEETVGNDVKSTVEDAMESN